MVLTWGSPWGGNADASAEQSQPALAWPKAPALATRARKPARPRVCMAGAPPSTHRPRARASAQHDGSGCRLRQRPCTGASARASREQGHAASYHRRALAWRGRASRQETRHEIVRHRPRSCLRRCHLVCRAMRWRAASAAAAAGHAAQPAAARRARRRPQPAAPQRRPIDAGHHRRRARCGRAGAPGSARSPASPPASASPR